MAVRIGCLVFSLTALCVSCRQGGLLPLGALTTPPSGYWQHSQPLCLYHRLLIFFFFLLETEFGLAEHRSQLETENLFFFYPHLTTVYRMLNLRFGTWTSWFPWSILAMTNIMGRGEGQSCGNLTTCWGRRRLQPVYSDHSVSQKWVGRKHASNVPR